MLTIYNKYTDQSERVRISKLELMDEYEEWNIMQAHYFISFACSTKIEKNESFEKIKINNS